MSLFLFCALLLGCGEKTQAVPELIEPMTSAESYRPAAKRNVDPVRRLYGKIVPTDYPCFFERPADLTEIRVGVGEYVEEGTVVAVAGTYQEEMDKLREEIASLERRRDMEKSASDIRLEKLRLEQMVEIYLVDEPEVFQLEKDMNREREELRYSEALIDEELREKKEELEELKEKEERRTLTAPHSGVVSYVRDTSVSNHAESYENIVVISDYNEPYIETFEVPINKYEYADYRSKWIQYKGKRIPVTEREYTARESNYALSVGRNPYVSFTAELSDLPMGADVVLFFQEGAERQVLSVGNDSIFRENGEAFVYVKREGQADEKRAVETGATNGLYTEIRSGLSEGEQILYRNEAIVPSKYEIFEAGYADYTVECKTDNVERGCPYTKLYLAECSGKFRRIAEVGAVEEGAELFSLKSSTGRSEVEAARIAIVDLDQDRKKQNADYQKKRQKLMDSLLLMPPFDAAEAGSDPEAVHGGLLMGERIECELNLLDCQEAYEQKEYEAARRVLQKEYERIGRGVDKEGYVECAPDKGRPGELPVNGTLFHKDDFILSFRSEGASGRFLFAVKSDGSIFSGLSSASSAYSAGLGQRVWVEKDGKVLEGTCIGINGNADRYMLFTRMEKQYVTWSAPFKRNAACQMYIEMDEDISEEDRNGAKLCYNGVDMKQMIVLPAATVKTETDRLSKAERYFVWKQEKDQIVKEYVTVFETEDLTGTVCILEGVKAGDRILNDKVHSNENPE